MNKKQSALRKIEKEANKICDSPYSLEQNEVLKSLEDRAWELCRKGDENGQIKVFKDFSNNEIDILLRLKYMREDYAKTAGNAGQYYIKDMEIFEHDTIPIGFHKNYNTIKNYWIIKYLNYITVFPHYCFSYRDLSHGKLIREQTDEFPAIYRSMQCYNFGEKSIFTIWDNFMLFIGWPDMILKDIHLLVQSAEKHSDLWGGHDMITDLCSLPQSTDKTENENDYYNQLNSMRKAYLEIQWETDYRSILSATNDYITSIYISQETNNNIDKSAKGFLVPLCQVPFGLGGYSFTLENDFGYNDRKVAKLKFMNKEHPIFAIKSAIWGHKTGVIYDTKKGIVSGTRDSIIKFLSLLASRNLLIKSDLRYLDSLE